VKYSGCGFAEIIFRENHSTLTMEIRDDGKGFDPAAITSRNGIKNMRQRAKNLNATLEIKSAEGEGTHIILIIDNP